MVSISDPSTLNEYRVFYDVSAYTYRYLIKAKESREHIMSAIKTDRSKGIEEFLNILSNGVDPIMQQIYHDETFPKTEMLTINVNNGESEIQYE